jgi:hypothetical protein
MSERTVQDGVRRGRPFVSCQTFYQTSSSVTLHPAAWIRKQGLTRPILMRQPQQTSGTCSNYKMRLLRTFKEQDVWTQHFFQQDGVRWHRGNVVLDDVFGSHVLQALRYWVVVATTFTGHESLRLFPLRLPQRSCTPHQPTHCSGVGSGNWIRCWRTQRSHFAWHSWKLCGLFTASPRGRRISIWTCVHMKTTCTQTVHESELPLMYHMLLCPMILRT